MRAAFAFTLCCLCGCNAAFGLGDLTFDGGAGAGGAGAGGTGTGGDITSTGGAGGVGTGTGGSGGMMTGDALSDEGLIARYFLADGMASTRPATATDASGNGLDLPITYVDGMPSWEQTNGNFGLRWLMAGADGGPSIAVDGTALEALDNTASATFEIVARIQDASAMGSRLFDIGEDVNPSFSLDAPQAGILQVRLEGTIVATWDIGDWPSSRLVFHLVFDGTDDKEPVQLFVNGTAVPSTMSNVPGNLELDIGIGDSFAIGNRAIGDRSIDGFIGYAAVYERPLTQTERTLHAILLLDSDDP